MHVSLLLMLVGLGCRSGDAPPPDDTAVETDDTGEGGTDSGDVVDTGPFDEDGDGFSAADDCDDTDATVYPGAEETWYDGIDSDCAGDDDYDQDGDGEQGDTAGPDCDDTDPAVNTSAEEVTDEVDNDCDRAIDENEARFGDVIITELMIDPVHTSDDAGEWFELHNTTDRVINLRGWYLHGESGETWQFPSMFKINPGAYKIVGVNADEFYNGGVKVHVQWNRNKLELDNDGDRLALEVDERTIFDIEYDATSWDLVPGASLSLDGDHQDYVYGGNSAYWCAATSELGNGDYGSPVAVNDWCSDLDHDGDGVSVDEGDCDDTDDTMGPDATELWDGIDNNCDGVLDQVDAEDAAIGDMVGGTYYMLGYKKALAVGDIDGDGSDELLAGSAFSSGSSGTYTYMGSVYVMDPANASGYSGSADSAADTVVSGTATYNYLGSIAVGDASGDTYDDLLVVGTEYQYGAGGTRYLGVLYESDGTLSSDADTDDAWLTFAGGTAGYSLLYQGIANEGELVDLSGDGLAEVVLSNPNVGYGGGGAVASVVWIFDVGSASGDLDVDDADLEIDGDTSGDQLGNHIARADMDGDGYSDLFLSAAGDDEGGTQAGAWYVMLGASDPTTEGSIEDVYDVKIIGSGRNDAVGSTNAIAVMDVDGDGTDDLVVGAAHQEEVYVFSDGSSLSGVVDTVDADLVISAASGGPDYFGAALVSGDVDGDGNADLLVSAPSKTSPYSATGAGTAGMVYLFDSATLSAASSTLDTSSADGSIQAASGNDAFGLELLLTDMDSDGADEPMVAAPGYTTSGWSTYGDGKIYLFDLN